MNSVSEVLLRERKRVEAHISIYKYAAENCEPNQRFTHCRKIERKLEQKQNRLKSLTAAAEAYKKIVEGREETMYFNTKHDVCHAVAEELSVATSRRVGLNYRIGFCRLQMY